MQNNLNYNPILCTFMYKFFLKENVINLAIYSDILFQIALGD